MADMTYIKVFVDYLDAIEPLGDAERGRLFTALLQYARTGEAPQLGGNERFIFPMMRAQLDRDTAAIAGVSEKRSKAGEKGAQAKQAKQANARFAKQNKQMPDLLSKTGKDEDKDKDKDKDKDEDEDKKGKTRAPRATPPTLADVMSYAEERGKPWMAQKFYEYFEAGNWVDAKGQPVRNWKQKFLTWEKYDAPDAAPPKGGDTHGAAGGDRAKAWGQFGVNL